ncbi:DUF2817 domain-containing protein [Candidatus Woesearchaeota archaeon]|nr:DUF2817 domain-containing protein [Candidatus Woesearchaeota archaeon]
MPNDSDLTDNDDETIGAKQLLEHIVTIARARTDVTVTEYGIVATEQNSFPLLDIASSSINGSDQPILVVTTGFHGDETCGPLTMMHHLDDIINYAHKQGVNIMLFPCINPSGFDRRTRYNHLNQGANNDAIRYQLEDGTWKDDLKRSNVFKRWVWSDEYTEEHGIVLPEETVALLAKLKKLPWSRVKGFLDIHQDKFSAVYGTSCTYAYCFPPLNPYHDIMKKLPPDIPILRNRTIDESHERDTDGNIPVTDDYGIVTRYDGSVTDAAHRLGVPYAAALETTTNIDLRKCYGINLMWIKGFVDLISPA